MCVKIVCYPLCPHHLEKYLIIYFFVYDVIIIHRALYCLGGSSFTGSCISGTVISTNGVTGTSSGDADPGN